MRFKRDGDAPIAAPIITSRLRLVPATFALARAELLDPDDFGALLGARIPDNWPPPSVAEALPWILMRLQAAPDCGGWFSWYGLAHPTQDPGGAMPVLVASGGFIGPPLDGDVAVGYAVLPQFQGRGFASEMAGALVDWALAQPWVERVVAETDSANPASVRVLGKLGFRPTGAVQANAGRRFELRRDRDG